MERAYRYSFHGEPAIALWLLWAGFAIQVHQTRLAAMGGIMDDSSMIQSTAGRSKPRMAPHRGLSPPPLAKDGEAGSRRQAVVLERLGWALMIVLLIIGLPMAYQRAVDNGPDLAGFCEAGRYILEHGTREPHSTLSRYWPSADVPWILFALLPISVTAVLWYGIGCITWFGLLRTIYGRLLSDCEPAVRRHATLAAGLLAMPLVIDGLCLGSFHILMVWLMILGLDRACRGEETMGGILLGIGAWLKLLPMLGIGFLIYQRKWKGALIALATVIVFDVDAQRCGLWSCGGMAGTRFLVAGRGRRHRQPAIDAGRAGRRRPPHEPVRGSDPSPIADIVGNPAGGSEYTLHRFRSAAAGPDCQSDARAASNCVSRSDGDPRAGRGSLLPSRSGLGLARKGIHQDRHDDVGHALVLAGRLELSPGGRRADAGHSLVASTLPLAAGRAGGCRLGRGAGVAGLQYGPRCGRALVDESDPGRGTCPPFREIGY